MEQLTSLLNRFDKEWQHRRRTLNTNNLLAAISDSAYNRHGISNSAEQLHASPSAICKALQKLPRHTFKTLHQQLLGTYSNSSRVFALDGSKFYVPKGFSKYGFKSRTNGVQVRRCAKRPIAMLSALVDVYTKHVHAYTVTKHFNERLAVSDLLPFLKKGDTVICDRGYYSARLYSMLTSHGINVVFRLKKDAFKAVKQFYSSSRSTSQTTVLLDSGKVLPMILHKYSVGGSKFVIGSSPRVTHVQKLYQLRWQVELCFRRLKSNLNLNYTFSLTPKLWEQHVEARILIDTVAVNDLSNHSNKDSCKRPKYKCRVFATRLTTSNVSNLFFGLVDRFFLLFKELVSYQFIGASCRNFYDNNRKVSRDNKSR